MIYVVLDTLNRQLERIRIRVAGGGHDVPADKVAKRGLGSFEQLAWFAAQVDRCFVFDNSLGPPDLVAEKTGGRLTITGEMPVDLFDVLAAHDMVWLDDHSDLDG